MEKVFPEKEVADDSLLLALNNADGATGDLDSLVNAPPERIYNYNVEQANYNRLFGKYLYKPPPPEEEELTEDEESATNAAPTGDPASEMTRKERRQARKEAKARQKEEQRLQEEAMDVPE